MEASIQTAANNAKVFTFGIAITVASWVKREVMFDVSPPAPPDSSLHAVEGEKPVLELSECGCNCLGQDETEGLQ